MDELNSHDLTRLNIVNVQCKVKEEFKKEAKERKILMPGLFEEMWGLYKDVKEMYEGESR